MKNNVKNTDFQGKNRVFVGIVSRLQYYTSCYIMNRTGGQEDDQKELEEKMDEDAQEDYPMPKQNQVSVVDPKSSEDRCMLDREGYGILKSAYQSQRLIANLFENEDKTDWNTKLKTVGLLG